MVQCMYITLGQGQNNSWSQCLFQIIKTFLPPVHGGCTYNFTFIGQMVSEKKIFGIVDEDRLWSRSKNDLDLN